MALIPDYYAILGVSQNASQQQIKRAYRRRALELHPDVNPSPDATFRFQLLNEAYQVLSHPLQRSVYDRIRSSSRYASRPNTQTQASSSPRERTSAHKRTGYSASHTSRPNEQTGAGSSPHEQTSRSRTAPPPEPSPSVAAAAWQELARPVRSPVFWSLFSIATVVAGVTIFREGVAGIALNVIIIRWVAVASVALVLVTLGLAHTKPLIRLIGPRMAAIWVRMLCFYAILLGSFALILVLLTGVVRMDAYVPGLIDNALPPIVLRVIIFSVVGAILRSRKPRRGS